MKSILRIGTRGSQLALYQANLVKSKLGQDFPMLQVEICVIKTKGDMIRRSKSDPFATKRIFTKEIEDALLDQSVDVAVHSAKDMSVQMPDGLKVGAVLARETARDCLISKDGKKISEMVPGSRIGTSSLRRKMQVHRLHPELVVEEVHGNVDSRIRKVNEGEFDAIILAHAGVKRLGLENYMVESFPEDKFYPAPGQGTIVVQMREGDRETLEFIRHIHHAESAIRLDCERAFLKRLQGGCQLPCGIHTGLRESRLFAMGALFSSDGATWVEASVEGTREAPEATGLKLAESILSQGGEEILERIRRDHG